MNKLTKRWLLGTTFAVISMLALGFSLISDSVQKTLNAATITTHNTNGTSVHSYHDNVVSFGDLNTTGSVGILSSSAVSGTYNMRNRGPENSSQGTALAYSSFQSHQHNVNNVGDTNYWSSLQVWIGFDGEMLEGMKSGLITNLSMDFYYGAGTLATFPTSSLGIDRTARAHSFFDLSYDLVTTDEIDYKGKGATSESTVSTTGNYIHRMGDIFAGTRAQNSDTGNGRDSRGETNGIDGGSGQDSWTLKSTTVNITTSGVSGSNSKGKAGTGASGNVIAGIAENGGFWLKLYAYTRVYSSWTQSGAWSQNACVFEGVKYTATFNPNYEKVGEPSFESNNTDMGSVTNDGISEDMLVYVDGDKPYYRPNQIITSAVAETNHFAAYWTGGHVKTNLKSEDIGGRDGQYTAVFEPIPVESNEGVHAAGRQLAYTYNGQVQGPILPAVAENWIVDGVSPIDYQATLATVQYNSQDSLPSDAGSYVMTAQIIHKDGTVAGWLMQPFTISPIPADHVTTPTGLTAHYGDSLADVVFPTVEGGSWAFVDTSSSTVGNAGLRYFTARFMPDSGNYTPVTRTVSVNVSKALGSGVTVSLTGWGFGEYANVPTVSFMPIGYTTYIFEYQVNCEGEWSVEIPTSAGTHYVRAVFEETDNYATYETVAREFVIERKMLGTSAFAMEAVEFVYNGEQQIPTITVKDGETLLVQNVDYEIVEFDAVNASDFIMVTVNFVGNYEGSAARYYSIAKANPEYVLPTDLVATYGDILETVLLPEGWAWEDKEQLVGNAGTKTFRVIYTPQDENNYNNVRETVMLFVEKANPEYTLPAELVNATYGDILGNIELPQGWTWDDGQSAFVGSVGSRALGVTFTPADTENYNCATAQVTVVVGSATLTIIDAAASDREYDGTNYVAVTGVLSGVAVGDEISLCPVGTIDSANVGNGYVVTFALVGDISNYQWVQLDILVNILPRQLTVTPIATGSIVGEELKPLLYNVSNQIDGEVPVFDGVLGLANYIDTVGNYAIIQNTLMLVDGENFISNNYAIVMSTPVVFYVVSNGSIYVDLDSIKFSSKVYDGTTNIGSVEIRFYEMANDERVYHDDIEFTTNAKFASKNAGNAVSIVMTQISLTGAFADFGLVYDLDGQVWTAEIKKASLTVENATVVNRTYDGTTEVVVGGTLAGVIGGDNVTLARIGRIDCENVGVYYVTYLLSGDAENYTLVQPSVEVTISVLVIDFDAVRRGDVIIIVGASLDVPLEFSVDGGNTWTTDTEIEVKPGTYSVTARVMGTDVTLGNYYSPSRDVVVVVGAAMSIGLIIGLIFGVIGATGLSTLFITKKVRAKRSVLRG